MPNKIEYQIYRQRRVPDDLVSFSMLVTWPDSSQSHEEVPIELKKADNPHPHVQNELSYLWKARAPAKPPFREHGVPAKQQPWPKEEIDA